MDRVTVINLLTNSGIDVKGMDDAFVHITDPSCILPAFDTVINYGWLVIVFFTICMLTGWAFLYIKNGTNINDLFNNAKTIILIFCVLSAVKPIVNVVYGDDLFGRGCEIKQVSLESVNELLKQRDDVIAKSEDSSLYEIFNVVDSGQKESISDDDEDDDDDDSDDDNATNTEDATLSPEERYSRVFSDYIDAYGTTPAPADQTNTGSTTPANTQINDFAAPDYTDTNNAENQTHIISAVYDKSTGSVIYTTVDGSKIKRTKGTVAWRNNNPGNIIDSKFARSHGAVGTSGKFAIFPDEATGMRAITALLRSNSYNNLSIKDAIRRWAPAADNNDPVKYAQTVARTTGLSPNRTIRSLNNDELQSVAKAIRKVEGWKPGKEQII